MAVITACNKILHILLKNTYALGSGKTVGSKTNGDICIHGIYHVL